MKKVKELQDIITGRGNISEKIVEVLKIEVKGTIYNKNEKIKEL